MTVQDIKKNEPFIAPLSEWVSDAGLAIPHQPYKKYLRTDIRPIIERFGVNDPYLEERELIAQVFPFKINEHT